MKRLLNPLFCLIVLTALVACNLPGWSTFTDSAYGFQLQYPPGGSVAPGDTAVFARIDLPIAPSTNLVEKYLEISVITDGSPCVSPQSLGYAPGSLTPTTLTINGLTWTRENAGEGAAGSIYDWVAYSTVSGSVCVNLTFILHSHNPGVFLPTVVPTYSPTEQDVFLQIVETFTWLSGSAVTPTAVGDTASVSGMLWYDQCPIPADASPVPSPLLAGCVTDSYGVDADGLHQPAEPFMTGITVNIGPGPCPVGGPTSTITDGSGHYSFSGLTPGDYCINVNAASFIGPGGTGHWTVIPSGHEGNTYRSITLSAGENLTGQDFAWYQFTGATPTPVATPTLVTCDTASLHAPTLLTPADHAVLTDLDPTLTWQYPDPCNPQGYRIDLSVDPTFADTSLSGGTGNPSTSWGPAHPLNDCTTYFWRVAPINGTTLGPFSGSFTFRTDTGGTCPTPTPTPVPGFTFIPNLNLNCHFGPGFFYDIVDVVFKGKSYPIDGKNGAGDWVRIMLNPNKGCWIMTRDGTPSGDLGGVRVLIAPPTPTPTAVPVVCASFKDQKSCQAQPACVWVQSRSITAATYYCTNK